MEEEDEENAPTQRQSEAEAQKIEISQKSKQKHHLPTIKEIVSEENAVSPLKFKREHSIETPKRLQLAVTDIIVKDYDEADDDEERSYSSGDLNQNESTRQVD